jgi:hypothetical protein
MTPPFVGSMPTPKAGTVHQMGLGFVGCRDDQVRTVADVVAGLSGTFEAGPRDRAWTAPKVFE